jgi:hypothetical protein
MSPTWYVLMMLACVLLLLLSCVLRFGLCFVIWVCGQILAHNSDRSICQGGRDDDVTGDLPGLTHAAVGMPHTPSVARNGAKLVACAECQKWQLASSRCTGLLLLCAPSCLSQQYFLHTTTRQAATTPPHAAI